MKKFRKLLCLTMAVMMLFALAATSSAAGETGTITVTNNVDGVSINGLTFKAYRVLDLTYNATTGAYSYSPNADFKAFFTAPSEYSVDTLAGETSDSATMLAFAKALEGYISDASFAGTAKTTVASEETAVFTDLPLGYYVVTGGGLRTDTSADKEIVSLCMIDTTDLEAEVSLKLEVPYVEKKVQSGTEPDLGGAPGATTPVWSDVADYNIGDEVPFKLSSKVPAMTGYDEYTVTFHDTLSGGLTFNKDSLTVSIGGTPLAAGAYTLNAPCTDANCSFSVTIKLKTNKVATYAIGADITVNYTAELNADALIYSSSNPNTVVLEYSNNPYKLTDTGKTPEDTVLVYTYELDLNKWRPATQAEIDDDAVTTTIINGDHYMPLTGAGFALYTDPKPAEGTDTRTAIAVVDMGNGTYRLADSTAVSTITEMMVSTGGTLKIEGLDEGTYYLKEVVTPDGYNPLEKEIVIVITSTDDGTDITNLTITQDGTIIEAIAVINRTGAKLPSTGGIGTTMFTVGGITLMGGAIAVIGIRKKRGSKDTDAE